MQSDDFELTLLDGTKTTLGAYDGKVLLVVNTASRCGFTPQYEGLEELYRGFRDTGFEVLAFPCNQFGAQEPLDESGIKAFLDSNYTITFPVFAKVEVNGENAHPLFKYLKEKAPGTMGTKDIKWNFTKFLISRDRKRIIRFASVKSPDQIKGFIKKETSD